MLPLFPPIIVSERRRRRRRVPGEQREEGKNNNAEAAKSFCKNEQSENTVAATVTDTSALQQLALSSFVLE